MTLPFVASKNPAAEAQLARPKIRLRDMKTGELLHLSGQGTTPHAKWAWLGTRKQADCLRRQARRQGQPWPFQPASKSFFEPIREVNE